MQIIITGFKFDLNLFSTKALRFRLIWIWFKNKIVGIHFGFGLKKLSDLELVQTDTDGLGFTLDSLSLVFGLVY